ncbi:hypothetical protein BDR06DRAFT_1024995 [Suillus hirtellus]|nr:hypothetical protein BDR06DRAFT_1024995 [Suillus hirtellus]
MLTILNEEETKAQFKAIFGGLAFGLSYGRLTRACVKLAVKFADLVLSQFAREVLLFLSTRFHDYRHCATASLEDRSH